MKSRANQPRLSFIVRIALAALPLSAGLLLSAQLLPGCAPGTVNCDDVDCDGSGGTSGGSGGGAGGGGGSAGGAGGSSGGSSGAVSLTTSVSNCGSFGSTIDEVEKSFFPMKCGTGKGGTCHGATAVWGDFSKQPLFSGTKAFAKASIACSGEKLINPTNAAKSVVMLKVSNDSPKCPDGSTDNGSRMPLDETDQTKSIALSSDELNCLTSYVKAVTGGK